MNATHRAPRPLSLAIALALCTASGQAYAASPLGVWLDNTGRGAVEIKPCGAALCGHVVWVKDTADAKGCGRQIIGDATASGGKYTGWIYSPEDRKRYNVEFSTAGDGRLKVVGYAGIRLFSKTMYWKPAAPDLARCDGGRDKPKPAVTAAATIPPVKPQAETVASSPQSAAPAATAPQSVPHPVPEAAPAALPAVAAQQPPASVPKVTAPPAAGSQEQAAEPSSAPAPAQDDAEPAKGPDLEKLSQVIGKVVKRTPGGGCKLDLPWVKVEFRCEDQ